MTGFFNVNPPNGCLFQFATLNSIRYAQFKTTSGIVYAVQGFARFLHYRVKSLAPYLLLKASGFTRFAPYGRNHSVILTSLLLSFSTEFIEVCRSIDLIVTELVEVLNSLRPKDIELIDLIASKGH